MIRKYKLIWFCAYHAFLEGFYQDQEPKNPHNAKSLAHKKLKEQGRQELRKLR